MTTEAMGERLDLLEQMLRDGTEVQVALEACGWRKENSAKRQASLADRTYLMDRLRFHPAPKLKTPAPAVGPLVTGQYVVVFPFYGGWTKERIKRTAHLWLHEAASAAGVQIIGELDYRLDRTAKGLFLVVQAPATTDRPMAEVRAVAEHWAYEHAEACPHLSAWADQHLQEAAA